MTEKVRAHAIIRGRVQGVCFRLETRDAARQQGVNGWVRNRPDGSVEALIEGERDSVEAVLAWCRRGPTISEVTDLSVSWETYSGEFSRFEIGY